MKKIYNYLFPVFLSFFALAACDEDNEEIVPMSYTDPVATVTKIEPVEGYVGNEFTINGDDFGIRIKHLSMPKTILLLPECSIKQQRASH